MSRVISRVWVALMALALCAPPGVARAEPPGPKATPVYVLSVWTNDVDDQAEALTQALRARVRQVSGWSLSESSQSFETLAIALRCPPSPNAVCLERIGDQLHTDRYIWGTMAKEKPGELTVDLRLWSRGKAQAEASESYGENLKDPSDEALRGIAGRLIAKLTGATTTTSGGAGGKIVVHAGAAGGTVLVDGVEKATLDGGVARVDVSAGAHTVTVRVPGFDAPPQTTSVKGSAEQDVTFSLSPGSPSEGVETESKGSFPVRRVLGYSAIVLGVASFAVAGVEGLNWLSDKNASDNDRKNVPSNVTDVCVDAVNAAALDACTKSRDATTVATIGWIFTGVGAALVGTGLWLVIGDHGASEAPHEAAARAVPLRRIELVPTLGPHGGALGLRGAF
jgi:hypothetical protein